MNAAPLLNSVVAALAEVRFAHIIPSKRAAGRPRDRALLDIGGHVA